MSKTSKHLLIFIALLFLPILACDDDAGTSAGGNCLDVAGKWDITEEIDASACDTDNSSVSVTATVTQNACQVSLDVFGVSFAGPMDGDTMHLKGSYEELGYITKDMTLKVSGSDLSGTATWTYDAYGLYSCQGTSTFTGSKK